VRIEASGTVTVDGPINANGNIGGGSGGSIYITCRIFAGTGGVLSADGANGTYWGGAGSAGRIAVICDEAAQNAAARPTVAIRTKVATGCILWQLYIPCSVGTIYLNADRAIPDLWASDASLSGFTNYSPSTLTVTNARVTFETRAAITVANDMNVLAAGRLDLRDVNLTVGRDLTVDNASLYVYANTNNPVPEANCDGRVAVVRNIFLGTNGWIYPASHYTNGGAIKFTAKNVTISDTNSGFNANGLGYGGGPANQSTNGFGPGGGSGDSIADGGGYGGIGGDGYWGAKGGNGGTYGVSNAPILPGSGGGGATHANPLYTGAGGAGGGLIWIEVPKGTLTMNGIMTAKGVRPAANYGQGGGSGGGIYLTCKSLIGAADRTISADGGYGGSYWAGGGGGGRIAVIAGNTNSWLGTATVNRGIGSAGNTSQEDPLQGWAWSTEGTIYWGVLRDQSAGTVMTIR
jgi:hypothetical protein